MFSHRTQRFWCLLVLAGAFVLRAGAAIGLQWHLDRTGPRLCLIAGDAEGYWELAHKLAAGDDFSIYDPPRQVLRMPGLPLFLAAAITLTGENHLAVRLLLAGVGTSACGLVYWLGRRLFDHRIGLIAAAIVATSPTLVVCSVMFLSETLFAAALVACLLAFTELLHSHRRSAGPWASRSHVTGLQPQSASAIVLPLWRRSFPGDETKNRMWLALAAGFLAAMATYVRPTWLIVGPAFALWHGLRGGRTAWTQSGLLVVSMVVALSPWVVRNYLATGHLVVTTLWVGPSLYDGLHPGANGDSEMTFIERDGVYDRMSEYDADRYYRNAAWNFVRDQPSQAIQLVFVKLARFWSPIPNADQFRHPAVQIAVIASFVPLVMLAMVGCWHVRCDASCWLLPLTPIVYFSLVHAVFVASLRYRLPAEYPLAVLAAVGVRCLSQPRYPAQTVSDAIH